MITMSSDQLHQMLHIAYPQLYKAAMGKYPLWVALWRGEHALTPGEQVFLQMRETRKHIEITGNSVSLTIPKARRRRDRIVRGRVEAGWSYEPTWLPFYRVYAGNLAADDTAHVDEFRAEITFS